MLFNEAEFKAYIKNLITTEVAKKIQPQKEWLNLSEVCEYFHLSKNSIKDRKWRAKNNFPCYQAAGICGNVLYCRSEVEEWLKNGIIDIFGW